MKKWHYWYNNIIARKKPNQRKFPYYEIIIAFSIGFHLHLPGFQQHNWYGFS